MTIAEIINAAILIITAHIVWQYTRAAQKSNEIQEKPILNLYLRKSGNGTEENYSLKVKNVGNGPAYNIRISNIVAGDYVYAPYFDEPNPILEKDHDEKFIKMLTKDKATGGVGIYDASYGFKLFASRLFSNKAADQDPENLVRTNGAIVISYKGINKKSYYSIFRIYPRIWFPGASDDFVVEFIDDGRGKYDIKKAKKICSRRETMKGVDSSAN